jgi:integrase
VFARHAELRVSLQGHETVGIRERQYAGLEGFTVNVSFRGLIVRSQRERVLDVEEEKALLDAYPVWLRRVCTFAVETCLSQGDVIRLTKAMIDYKRSEIVPMGGRLKTGVKQRAPLTDRARPMLDEIERERRAGRIVANVNGLVFMTTRDNGAAITRNMITSAVTSALRKVGIKDFRFHDYRHIGFDALGEAEDPCRHGHGRFRSQVGGHAPKVCEPTTGGRCGGFRA